MKTSSGRLPAAAGAAGGRPVWRRPLAGALAALAILAAAPVAGQSGDEEASAAAWHIVRDGDKLMLIARDYLGSKGRWREIWELNRWIENPDFLLPGTRLRMPLPSPEVSIPAARLVTVSGRVDDKPNPLPWLEARQNDLLLERDGIRTYRDSSTEMRFIDGTGVLLTEESLVYVRRKSSREVPRPDRREVEIVEGQADVALASEQPERVAVEIVVAGTRTRPRPGEEGAQTRARAARAGGAELMVYEGSSEVEAAGGKVELERGMGTSVPAGGPPSPPEKLLPAPHLLAPEAGSEWAIPDPRLAWSAVPGAVSYTVEICADPQCAALVRRLPGVPGSEVQAEPLPVAALFWRVTAVSESGLDGFPSPASPFAVLSDRRDDEPPTGRISLAGAGWAGPEGTLRAGSTVVSVTVEDAGSGVASWTARVNGEEVPPARLAGPWESGAYRVEATALDRAGHRAELPPLTFEVDADPPRLEVELRWVRPLLTHVRPGLASRRWLARKRRFAVWAAARPASEAGRGFWVVAAGSESSPIALRHGPDPFETEPSLLERELRVEGDLPQAIVLAAGVEPPGPGGPADDGRFLWIRAWDDSSRVEWLAVRSEGGELVIEAEDALANRARLALPYR
ncbi:MAG: hypothetical protein R3325_09870 [Thermoanaerobaculia bacterium]|nr:hypothetical protein [Thermoanaerobaculia bacterium]